MKSSLSLVRKKELLLTYYSLYEEFGRYVAKGGVHTNFPLMKPLICIMYFCAITVC